MHYYFDIDDGTTFVEDEVGVELTDLDAALREAAVTATSIARDLLSADGDVVITVRDGDDLVGEARISRRVIRYGSPEIGGA